MKKAFLIILWILFLKADIYSQNKTITTFNNIHQRFGNGNDTRTVIDTFSLPATLTGYKQIIMHYSLSCPSGGCDPWDRAAWVSLKSNDQWIELGRYMTPYKKACGADYDVTDYSTLLTGEIILSSFIDTWVDPGWLVKITFEYVAGTPTIPNTKVENLWQDYGLVYGDPTKTGAFPIANTVIESNAEKAKLKVVLTGHGQGNTENAAEFSQKTHQIYVNDVSTFSHYLWRSDCGTNTCSPQSGTWQYNRAGWCPGASVIPVYYDLSSKIKAGQQVKFEYRLQSYTNQCRPSNINCKSGTTCSDCNYNYNGHTEPYYAMAGQLITYLGDLTGISKRPAFIDFSVSPNPAANYFELYLSESSKQNIEISIYNAMGEKIIHDKRPASNRNKLRYSTDDLSSGIYFVRIDGQTGFGIKRLVIQH